MKRGGIFIFISPFGIPFSDYPYDLGQRVASNISGSCPVNPNDFPRVFSGDVPTPPLRLYYMATYPELVPLPRYLLPVQEVRDIGANPRWDKGGKNNNHSAIELSPPEIKHPTKWALSGPIP